MKSNEVFLSFLILVFLIFSLYWGLRCRKCKKIKKNRENYDLITKPDVSCKTQPVICPSGSYCPAMTGLPSICPMGSYCPSNGLSGPILCSAGYTCQTNGLTLQTICPTGSYCSTTTGPSILCPIGSYCPSSGLTGPILCSAGYTCQSNGLTLQTICPTGSYCPTTTGPPILCPIGSYCPLTGMVKPVKNIIKDIKLFDTLVYNSSTSNTKINFTSVIIRSQIFGVPDINNSTYTSTRNVLLKSINLSFQITKIVSWILLDNEVKFNLYLFNNQNTSALFTIDQIIDVSLWDVSLWSFRGTKLTPPTQNTYSFNFTPNEPINIDNNSYFFLKLSRLFKLIYIFCTLILIIPSKT